MPADPLNDRIRQLREQIAALEGQLPKHSIPPALLLKLEALEDELQALLVEQRDDAV